MNHPVSSETVEWSTQPSGKWSTMTGIEAMVAVTMGPGVPDAGRWSTRSTAEQLESGRSTTSRMWSSIKLFLQRNNWCELLAKNPRFLTKDRHRGELPPAPRPGVDAARRRQNPDSDAQPHRTGSRQIAAEPAIGKALGRRTLVAELPNPKRFLARSGQRFPDLDEDHVIGGASIHGSWCWET
jgi:hypothetical protein